MTRSDSRDPVVTIPEHWSAEEALIVASFLRRLSLMIWDTHGRQMARFLYRNDDLSCGAPIDLPDPARDRNYHEDDSLF